jgi:hypothetical protein
MESSVHCLSPPNTYSYVQEENLGSPRKVVENQLLFSCITNQICALHQQSMGWRNLSKTVKKSSSSSHAASVFGVHLEVFLGSLGQRQTHLHTLR